MGVPSVKDNLETVKDTENENDRGPVELVELDCRYMMRWFWH